MECERAIYCKLYTAATANIFLFLCIRLFTRMMPLAPLRSADLTIGYQQNFRYVYKVCIHVQAKWPIRPELIAHCKNLRGLGRVSCIDSIENLNISTEMLLNEKLPSQV